jgi:pyruvate/2-oxoglutarate dehydrogenase complex dihydrolipoamide dehydrogenase (E3) component
MTEQQARGAGLDVRVGFTSLPSSSRGFIHGPGNDGFIKLIADGSRGVLVGATSASPSGGEILGALSVAVYAEVRIATLQSTVWAYPTFHWAIGEALREL